MNIKDNPIPCDVASIAKDYIDINESGLFDKQWYLRFNHDVLKAGIDPIEHFCRYGWKELRDPSPYFSVSCYLDAHPELLVKKKQNPLSHYINKYFNLYSKNFRHNFEIIIIEASNYFDEKHYLSKYPKTYGRFSSQVEHYYYEGAYQGRDPSIRFQSSFYLSTYSDVENEKINPLFHFLRWGYKEGRFPTKELHEINLIQTSGMFDKTYYTNKYPDIADASTTPVEHFYFRGGFEGRSPSHQFNVEFYINKYPDAMTSGLNPLIHYLTIGKNENRAVNGDLKYFENKMYSIDDDLKNVISNAYVDIEDLPSYEKEIEPFIDSNDMKLICFYLPQFHPFPENNSFWGKGFTEWTNVTKARPLFKGHNQPNLPGELGFYDTRVKDVLYRQIELAKQYGIYGFCMHHYFFNGKKVMRVPFDTIISNKDLNINFCLHWANEPWTVNFDGRNDNKCILIEQKHSQEDDLLFIQDIAVALKDDRYIRVNGRPLLLIYRSSLFPNINNSIEIWRDYCHSHDIENPFIVLVKTDFEHILDPTSHDFDASVEFPPHGLYLDDISAEFDFFDKSFSGCVYNYNDAIDKAKKYVKPRHREFRGVMTHFDCTPRRKNAGIFVNSTPRLYQKWLETAMDFTHNNFPPNERLVFINAWNEWAEGAYLEPDRCFGYAYLNATSKALQCHAKKHKIENKFRRGVILVVTHDTNLGGSQVVIYNIIKWFFDHTAFKVFVVTLSQGNIYDKFASKFSTLSLDNAGIAAEDLKDKIKEFCGGIPNAILVNSVASLKILPCLKTLNAPIVTYVHELEESIRVYASEHMGNINFSDYFVACSDQVKDNLIKKHSIDSNRIDTIYASISIDNDEDEQLERNSFLCNLGLSGPKIIAVGCGIGLFWRKGADIFIDIARRLKQNGIDNILLIWIGEFDNNSEHNIYGKWEHIHNAVHLEGLQNIVKFIGLKDNPRKYFKLSDIFLLTSREDPFPLVCLEAAYYSNPIICFKSAGGIPSFVEKDAGIIVEEINSELMCKALLDLAADTKQLNAMGAAAKNKVISRYTSDSNSSLMFRKLQYVAELSPPLSVIVPNFNKYNYLTERLDSILSQTFQDFELIILDDCSTDDSHLIFDKYSGINHVKIYKNTTNNGVFKQWLKGIELAKSDLIWIAEADDVSDKKFLESVLPSFMNNKVKLSYSSSAAIDKDGNKLFKYSDIDYLKEISNHRWDEDYIISADSEVQNSLIYRNTIPNVSAVVFRKHQTKQDIEKSLHMKIAGDWMFYLHTIKDGLVSFHSSVLNFHRRHDDTCTNNTAQTLSRFEEIITCQLTACTIYDIPNRIQSKARSMLRRDWEQENLTKLFGMSFNDLCNAIETSYANQMKIF